MVHKRGGRKRVLGTRAPIASGCGQMIAGRSTSSSIGLACGRRFRILAIFDDCTRECLGAVADTSVPGQRGERSRGRPGTIVSDNGTELTSNVILSWADQAKVGWHYIAQGKPMQNALVARINGLLRDEFLNEPLLTSVVEVRLALERWNIGYATITTCGPIRGSDGWRT